MFDVEEICLDRHFADGVCIRRQVGCALQNVTGDIQSVQCELVATVVAAVAAGVHRFFRAKIVRGIGGGSAPNRAVSGDTRGYGDKVEEIASGNRQVLQLFGVHRGLQA